MPILLSRILTATSSKTDDYSCRCFLFFIVFSMSISLTETTGVTLVTIAARAYILWPAGLLCSDNTKGSVVAHFDRETFPMFLGDRLFLYVNFLDRKRDTNCFIENSGYRVPGRETTERSNYARRSVNIAFYDTAGVGPSIKYNSTYPLHFAEK